jgi:adenine-specific DNA-methyltransferase
MKKAAPVSIASDSTNKTTPTRIVSLHQEALLKSLLGVALSLVPVGALTPVEKSVTRHIKRCSHSRLIAEVVAGIKRGEDPLGNTYCAIKDPTSRRGAGQTFTPSGVVATMLDWAGSMSRNISRVVDPGAGTGRYTMAALKRFPRAHAVAVEFDPYVAILLRANLAACGLSDRCRVIVGDYRKLKLPSIAGRTLFIGNPPYLRHHGISSQWKQWYSTGLKKLGASGSQIAGLHLHFFLKTYQLARPKDLGCFITAAEWLDSGYGSALRELLTDNLGGIAICAADPALRLFDDALVSAVITAFAPGTVPKEIRFSRFSSLAEARNLSAGRSVLLSEARSQAAWSTLYQNRTVGKSTDQVELGEICRVSRGQITGQNSVWIHRKDTPELPARFLVPTITKAFDIIRAPDNVIEGKQALRRVISLPTDLDTLLPAERVQVEAFLRWARAEGADKTYTAKHRAPWHRVRLDRPGPPIVMTYMRRGPPIFARNKAGAQLLNIAHGLFPKTPLSESKLVSLIRWLNKNVRIKDGRMYAGGLVKFEPSVAMKIRVPRRFA